eukprot:7468287-Prorocentrum_lima.AAC.1
MQYKTQWDQQLDVAQDCKLCKHWLYEVTLGDGGSKLGITQQEPAALICSFEVSEHGKPHWQQQVGMGNHIAPASSCCEPSQVQSTCDVVDQLHVPASECIQSCCSTVQGVAQDMKDTLQATVLQSG